MKTSTQVTQRDMGDQASSAPDCFWDRTRKEGINCQALYAQILKYLWDMHGCCKGSSQGQPWAKGGAKKTHPKAVGEADIGGQGRALITEGHGVTVFRPGEG